MQSALLAILSALVLAGWCYHLAACWCACRRLGRPASNEAATPWPRVSILKPLCGNEPGLLENLQGFCDQDYPEYEILLGVGAAADAALEVANQLQARCAGTIRVAIAPRLGANPKSAILHHLVRQARGEVLVISDSDIQVQRDYLKRVVAPLGAGGVGLVTCLYALRPGGYALPGQLEALYVNLTFLPAVALASHIRSVPLAVGATMALRKGDLIVAGGYPAIRNQLADDHAVARLIRGAGLLTVLSDVVVRHAAAEAGWGAWWRHEVRRARTLRVVEPRRYLALPLTFAVPWAVALTLASGAVAWSLCLLGATLAVRLAAAAAMAKRTGLPPLGWSIALLPLRDTVDVAVFISALAGRRITWRGRTYHLARDGGLLATGGANRNLARGAVRWIDARLRHREGIFEYSDDPQCLFRIQLVRARTPVNLLDGTHLDIGERYVELHLWNEHIPAFQTDRGPGMKWGLAASRGVRKSLRLLARFVESRPELHDLRAVHGRTVLVTRSAGQLAALLGRLGFEFHGRTPPGGILDRLHQRGEDLLIWALTWTFNPLDRSRRILSRTRHDAWMSRQALIERYSRQEPGRPDPATHAGEEIRHARKAQTGDARGAFGERPPGEPARAPGDKSTSDALRAIVSRSEHKG